MPRFSRRRFVRRRRGRRTLRRFRKVVSRIKRKSRRKALRKQRAKSYLHGYSGANHLDGSAGTINYGNPEPYNGSNGALGLFGWRDAQEMFEQVKVVDDLIFPGVGATTQGHAGNRVNLRIRAKAEQTFTVSNGNQAGSIWLEVYICKPRKGIPTAGITGTNDQLPEAVIQNNLNNAFMPDYNDGRGITLGASPFPINNATSQTKPTVNTSNYLVTPYMVPPFTQNWKVIKQLKYVLPPAGQCMFKVKTRWLNITRQQYFPKGSGTGVSSGDWSIIFPSFARNVFFRWHGQPVHDDTDHALVNYGSGALDIVNVKRYWYSHSVRPLPSYNLLSNVNQGTIANAHLPSGTLNPVKEDDTPDP